jgi:hypothetical protein
MILRLLAPGLILGFLGRPVPAQAGAPPSRAENIIIVTLDGFRHQDFFAGADESLIDAKAGGVPDAEGLKHRFWRETAGARRERLLPFLWGTFAKDGQIFGDRSHHAPARLTNGKKFSYPGYNELFCGFADERIDSNAKIPNPNRSVLEFLDERTSCRGRVAAFCSWDVFPSIFRSDRNSVKVHAGWASIDDEPLSERQRQANLMLERLPRYWPDNVYDAITMEAASEHLRKHKPRVLFIGLGETDEWAHGRRYDLYLQAAHAADRYLRDLWETLRAMPEYEGKTALIVTTDHGRGGTKADWTDHGPKVEGAEDLWIAVLGPGTPALGVREDVAVTQGQVAATIARLIGEDFQAESPRSAPPLPGVCPAEVGTPRMGRAPHRGDSE